MDSNDQLKNLEQLKNRVRDWVKLDNEIRELKKEQKLRDENKKKISEDLIRVMKQNELEVFDLKDGQLVYTQKKVKKPVSQKQLVSVLSTYFKGNTDKANELNNFILESREEVVRESIKRVINKQDDL